MADLMGGVKLKISRAIERMMTAAKFPSMEKLMQQLLLASTLNNIST
jgi:hypothetical protein